MGKKANSTLFQNLASSDLEKLLELNLNINKLSFQLDGKYNVLTSDFEHKLKFALNDFDINFDGKGDFENKAYKGKFEISDPKTLTDTVSQIYISGINPILLKLDNPSKELNITLYNQIATNIKDNGFDALAAFHENDSLKENDKLVANLTFNLEGFEFNINEKGFLKILTDERVVKFLQAMPSTDKAADK